jgi:hypothetical protein
MQRQTQIKTDILLQINIPSCSNQDGGLRGDGFSWYSDEDISRNEQQEREKKPEWQTVSHKRKGITRKNQLKQRNKIIPPTGMNHSPTCTAMMI